MNRIPILLEVRRARNRAWLWAAAHWALGLAVLLVGGLFSLFYAAFSLWCLFYGDRQCFAVAMLTAGLVGYAVADICERCFVPMPRVRVPEELPREVSCSQ